MSEKKPNAIQRVGGNIAQNVAINRAAGEIAAWIERENVTPQQLEAWAQNNSPVIVGLLSGVVVDGANWARGMFGSVAKGFTQQHIWEIVRSLAGVKPEHAQVLADPRYWPWFLAQMEQAKAWLSQG